MRSVSLRFDPYLLLLFALSLFALVPLAASGYFYSAHDGRHSVFFVTMFDEAIRSGALWPRWAMHHNQGYGYPTFLVQAPLAFYLAEFFVLLGFAVTNALKIAWSVGILAGAWGTYALVKSWILEFSQKSSWANLEQFTSSVRYASICAVVAGLLYTYAPYHLLDIYVRAAFAETMLMAWFPWIFLAFDRLIIHAADIGWQGRMLVAALSYAALLLTHAFALVAFTPFLTAFILFRLWMLWRREIPRRDKGRDKDKAEQGEIVSPQSSPNPTLTLAQRTAVAVGAGCAALLLAAIFLLPLFVEGPVLVQEEWTQNTYDYTRHWIYWGQFFSPFWGYGYSDDPTGATDGMGFQIGVVLILLTLLAVYILWTSRTPHLNTHLNKSQPSRGASQNNHLHLLIFFLLVASFAILATVTSLAEPLWRVVPLLEVIQFPWRLLLLTTFSLSVLGGLVLSQLSPQLHDEEGGLLVIMLVVIFASFAYSQPEALQPAEPWREDGRAVMQFEQEHPDMVGSTRFVEERFTSSPMTEQYLRPEFSTDALERLAVIEGEGEVLDHYSLGHAFGGEVMMEAAGTVQIQLYEFPGWQVKVDGEVVEHRVSPPFGLIEVDVPSGYHQIDVWMGSTWARTTGLFTSAITLLLLVGLWLISRRTSMMASV